MLSGKLLLLALCFLTIRLTILRSFFEDETSRSNIPDLLPDDMSGNYIENGDFKSFEGWVKFHLSKVDDEIKLGSGDNYVFWERLTESDQCGSVGLYQDINVDVDQMKQVILRADVWIDLQKLKKNNNDKNNDLIRQTVAPVRISVIYNDINGKIQRWDQGFVVAKNAEKIWKLNPKTGKRQNTKTFLLPGNKVPVPRSQWCHFIIDLKADGGMKDINGKILPTPTKISRIMIYGNGWDYRGAIGNLMMTQNKTGF